MAYDKIIAIRARLDRCLAYAANEEKTGLSNALAYIQNGDKTHQFVSTINCDGANPFADMMATKRRWGKLGGVQGYHIVHSYAPGELSPQEAHDAGVEFAKRLLEEKYEVVVATHLDHDHLHCHIVFNSVSFVDGQRYRNDFTSYYRDIRGISNEISRERGLSEIQPKQRGRHYAEWNAERQGKPTIRSLVRKDINAAVETSFTYREFLQRMRAQGYTIKAGEHIKHTALKPPGAKRFLRLDSLGTEYTEQRIQARIAQQRSGGKELRKEVVIPVCRRYRVKQGWKRRAMPRGLRRRYLYFLSLLSPRGQRKNVPIRAEVIRLNRYLRQYRFLSHYRIETTAELTLLQDALQAEIDAKVTERAKLYRLRQKYPSPEWNEQIAGINIRLRQLRKERKLCQQIEQTLPWMAEATQKAKPYEKERTERRKELWK